MRRMREKVRDIQIRIMPDQVLALSALKTIHDQVRVQGHGRPFLSTAWLPSEFQHVASSLAEKEESGIATHGRCGVCRGSNHNA